MKRTIPENGKEFIGLSKKEILIRLGEGFNFYPDNQWSYILKKYWYGRKKVLYIEFDAAEFAINQYIKSKYGKI